MLLAAALFVWTGVAGPIFAEGFWKGLETWQTFWGALIALAAAYLAVRPVYGQLAEQRRQSAAAAVSMIVKAAVALEAERDTLRKARDDLWMGRLLASYDDQPWESIYSSWPDSAFEFMKTIDAASRNLLLYSERNPEPSRTQQCRLDAIEALHHLRGNLVDLVTIMRQETSGLDYEEGEEDIPDDQHAPRRILVDVGRRRWADTAEELEGALSAEISNVWKRIRELERIALRVTDN